MNFDHFNEQQKEAVLKTTGPLLILAGAGSGKTKVLTSKVAHLIAEGVDPENILAITFTNKASKEMKDRIISLLGSLAFNIQISTFHSFGLKIIKDNYENLGYSKNFTIIDSDDSLILIKKLMKDLNIDSVIYNPKAIKHKISSLKNELMTPEMYRKYAKIPFDEIVLKIYHKYDQKLKSNNSIDFDDLLILPIHLFRTQPLVLAKYQEQYQYILIDEYQDTNEAQYILTKMISAKYKNICVVGDADQSIYAFRGANYQNILNFERDYPNATTILLEQNYRSTKNILNAANSVIKHNHNRKDKTLWSNNDLGEIITYNRCYDERHEASYISGEIIKLKQNGTAYNNIAILYRTNAQSRVFEEELLKNSIPYKIIGSVFFYNRKEIKDLICYLRLIYNPNDDISLLRCINTPKRQIGPKTIEKLITRANDENISIYEAISDGKELNFKQTIDELKTLSTSSSLTELIDLILDKTGIKQEYLNEKSLDGEIRLENLAEFKSITTSFEQEQGIVSLGEFLEQISLVSDISEHKEESEQVSLMTVHAVKGLEFDVVFIAGLEETIFPHVNSMMDDQSLEEERRLCYVAITRAKKNLYLTNARRRMIFGKYLANQPSRFINEINSECISRNSIDNTEPKELIDKESMMYDNEIEYKVGEKVLHDKFGQGIITKIDKTVMTIAFKYPYGIRVFMKNHKSISKV